MASKRYGMLIDLRKCVGCEACTVACKAENDVPLGSFRTRVQTHEAGTYPKVNRFFVPTLCNHCDEPGCVSVCPTGASFKREDGIVEINKDECVGCRYCISACPYGARYMGEDNIADKCSFCLHRVEQGIVPSCVNTCVVNGRVFGDLNDPNSEISKAIKQKGVIQIEGTSMYYRIPEQLERQILPPNYDPVQPMSTWKKVLQPTGKVMLGGVLGAIAISVAANALSKKTEHEEGE